MSYNSITNTEIASGEPVLNTTQTKIKENFENLNSRVSTLEGGGSVVYAPIILRINGSYGESGDLTIPSLGILKTTCNFNMIITGVRLLIDNAGVSGTTQVDVQYKRGAGSWTSVFTTKPSVSYSSGDDSVSTNGVLDAGEVSILAGDLIRLNIDSVQARASGLMVRIDYIKS